jgi:hypothetical protein
MHMLLGDPKKPDIMDATACTLVCLACPCRKYDLCGNTGKNFADHADAHTCPLAKFPSRGLGDTIDKLTTFTGIKAAVKAIAPDCGCEKRRDGLNSLIPYPKAP